jgi:hypothetical protein
VSVNRTRKLNAASTRAGVLSQMNPVHAFVTRSINIKLVLTLNNAVCSLHGVTSQKIAVFKVSTVRTSSRMFKKTMQSPRFSKRSVELLSSPVKIRYVCMYVCIEFPRPTAMCWAQHNLPDLNYLIINVCVFFLNMFIVIYKYTLFTLTLFGAKLVYLIFLVVQHSVVFQTLNIASGRTRWTEV